MLNDALIYIHASKFGEAGKLREKGRETPLKQEMIIEQVDTQVAETPFNITEQLMAGGLRRER